MMDQVWLAINPRVTISNLVNDQDMYGGHITRCWKGHQHFMGQTWSTKVNILWVKLGLWAKPSNSGILPGYHPSSSCYQTLRQFGFKIQFPFS